MNNASETRADWRQIEREERTRAASASELSIGESVAWSLSARMAQTDGFSAVHRVGQPSGGTALTMCGEIIPPPVNRVPLTPRLAQSLGRCRYCETAMTKAQEAA